MSSPSLPVPEGFQILQQGRNGIIRRRWFTHAAWFLLFFCLFWNTFLVFWYVMAFRSPPKNASAWLPILFPLGHVAIGLGLLYFVLSLFLNKTDIIFAAHELRVRTHPLPWPGNQVIRATNLAAFLVREREISRKNSRSTVYDLLYVDSTNHEQPLVKKLPRREQADYLLQTLTRFYLPQKTS